MYPVLSPKWCGLVGIVKKIADIADMESKLPKKSDGVQSLWDSEEIALRYILEDEKLNLCMRLVHEAKVFQHQVLEHKTTLKDDDARLLETFEQRLGSILRRVWGYVEAMQTTDLPFLMEYCAEVLQKTMVYPQLCASKDMAVSQEVLVLHYLRNCFKFMSEDAYPARRIMGLVERYNVVERIVMFVNLNHEKMKDSDVVVGCEALAYLFDTDEYTGDRTKFVPADLRQELAGMDGNVIPKVIKGSSDAAGLKRRIRPLMDEAMRFKSNQAKSSCK